MVRLNSKQHRCLWCICVTLLQFVWRTCAVTCYQCSSANPNCAESFHSNGQGVTTCEGTYCISSVSTNAYESVGIRTCSSTAAFEECRTTTSPDGTTTVVCACTKNLCNGYASEGDGVINLNRTGNMQCYECFGSQCNLPDAQKSKCSGNSCFQMNSFTLANQVTLVSYGCLNDNYGGRCLDEISAGTITRTCYCNFNLCNGNTVVTTTTSTTTTNIPTIVSLPKVTCYECSGANCSVAPIDVQQCLGGSCLEIRTYDDRGQSLVMRSCHDTSSSTSTTCQIIEYQGTSAVYCTCSADYCNYNLKYETYVRPPSFTDVKCYQCVGSECDKPLSNLTTCSGVSCARLKIEDPYLMTRMCVNDLKSVGCSSSTILQKTVQTCYCNANYCNKSTRFTVHLHITIFLTFAGLVFKLV